MDEIFVLLNKHAHLPGPVLVALLAKACAHVVVVRESQFAPPWPPEVVIQNNYFLGYTEATQAKILLTQPTRGRA